MNILLLNPPELKKSDGQEASFFDGTDTGYYPHIGLLSLASNIAAYSDYDVKVIDSVYDRYTRDEIIAAIKSIRPTVIGLTVYTHTLFAVHSFINIIKEIDERIVIVLGGPHLTLYAKETAYWDGVDYVISGEGENVFLDLVKAIANSKSATTVEGLSYVESDGSFVDGGYNIIQDLDKLPDIDVTLFDASKAFCAIGRENTCASIVTSRGCPFRCTFCYSAKSKYRLRSLDKVINEIKIYVSQGINEFMIWDELFNINSRRVIDFSNLLLENGLKISWSFRGRVNAINEEVIKTAKNAGCHRIHFGVEVGSDVSLKIIKKAIKIKQVKDSVALCKKYKIVSVTNWIFGFPFEKKEDLKKTLDFSIELDSDYVEYNCLIPFPGTEVFIEGVADGQLDDGDLKNHVKHPVENFEFDVFETHLSREELKQYVDYAYKKYYLRISYILKSLFKTRSLFELKQKVIGGLKVLLQGQYKKVLLPFTNIMRKRIVKTKPTKDVVLTLSLSHDSGAALFVRGKLVAAVSEERLNRIKLTRAFPEKSINEVLDIAGLSPGDITKVVLASHITPNWLSLMLPGFHSKESINVFSPLLFWVIREHSIARRTGLIKVESALVRKYVRKRLKPLDIRCPIESQHHHISHSYCAYSSADFDHSIIVSIDTTGDGLCCMASLGDDGELEVIDKMDGCSPGFIYLQLTQLLGYTPSRHEGKLTGLAAHGDPSVCEPLFKKLMQFRNGKFKVLKTSNPNHPIFREIMKHRREDITAGLQKVFEDVVVRYVEHLVHRYKRNRIALVGGIFANVKLNQRIHEIEGIKKIYVFPHMGDGGTPVGAGFAHYKTKPNSLKSPYLGRGYSQNAIEDALRRHGLDYQVFEEIEMEAAKLLAQKKVIARYTGRMEYGPRALGNRSILYFAGDVTVNDWLNKKLKRTEFMPFAPSTLIEFADEYYQKVDGALTPAKYMTLTFDCTERSSREQPACVHVDDTARPQLVDPGDNYSYYKIIKHYYDITGIATILNTSFNLHEEPIVNTPDDAIRSFQKSDLDALVIGNCLVLRQQISNLNG